jgi:DNA repair protein RecN (Recombination protein N)
MATFQLEEIDKVAPRAGEDERLSAERARLANADRLARLSAEAYALLYDGEGAALDALAAVWKRLDELATLDPSFGEHAAQRDEVKSRLDDLAFVLRDYTSDLDASPERLQKVEDRLAALERLERRYGPGLDDVLARREALKEELEQLGASGDRAAKLARIEQDRRREFQTAAGALSASRTAAARRLDTALVARLAELAMPHARVDVRVGSLDQPAQWSATGADAVEFFLSPNPGEELRPLARIASGGELSRVMLALRTLATPDEPGRTLVFDEVDAGIGGTGADAVGARLQALGARYQVLCITHLPQIAARGDVHFQISKAVRSGRTVTDVTRLDEAGRVEEIGRMIAGATISDGVLASARDLLAGRRRSETKAKGESETRRMAKAKGRRRGA